MNTCKSSFAPKATAKKNRAAGCPFCNFDECKRNRCQFYINNTSGAERGCMVELLYHQNTVNRIFLIRLITKVLRLPTILRI